MEPGFLQSQPEVMLGKRKVSWFLLQTLPSGPGRCTIFILSGKSQPSVLSERREVGPGGQAHLDGVGLLPQALSAHSLVPSSIRKLHL